ncbi:MAG: flavin reductase family protein [Oscillospiraceae bacterium]
MKKTAWKGGALLAPVPPVLVSCGTMEEPNVLTIAWTGMLATKPCKTYISVRPTRHSYNIIKNSGEFVINLPTAPLVRAIDFCGCKSGADTNKWEAAVLTPQPGVAQKAPMVEESPISIECKVCEIVPLGTHDMFIADVVAVHVADDLMDGKGTLHIERAGLCSYAHGQYFALGKKIGDFGFSVKKKKKKPQYSARK